MFDQSKADDLKSAIEAVASEYDANGVPDVARNLRELAAVPPATLSRLFDIIVRTKGDKASVIAELKSGAR